MECTTHSHLGSSPRRLVAPTSGRVVLNHRKKCTVVLLLHISTQPFKPMRERTTAVIFLSQRNRYKFWSTWEVLFKPEIREHPFKPTKLTHQKSKTMKFSLTSIVALVALFSQASAASVMHCTSYFHSLQMLHWS